jgi:transposase
MAVAGRTKTIAPCQPDHTQERQAQKRRSNQRRRRREFLDFMNQVVAEYGPETELHVVLDNLSTHKPKHDRWLARHKNVHLHYTPTHTSWLNQIEIWFSKLARAALQGASFASVAELRKAIEDYITAHNRSPQPFEWTKAEVRPKAPVSKYANLSK